MEYFRMALPLMTKQATGVNPVSYAVWYEYVSTENPALRHAVDVHLAQHGPLDEAGTEALFRRHIADFDAQTAAKVADGAQRVLAGMAESASAAGGQTEQYSLSLSRLAAQLAGARPNPLLQQVITDTEATHTAIKALQQQLEDSGREIASLREEVRRARRESMVDSLTGLPNRRAFDQRLTAAIALAEVGAGAAPPCLVIADIDHFKQINDRYGHSFGDQVLRAVAKVLESQTPDHSLAARIGGEEFALLLPGTSLQAALTLADKIRTTISQARIRRAGQTDLAARITLSFGLAAWRPDDDADALLERADQALYEAKQQGRDRVVMARR
jgi:diguanylate cyclase